MVETKHTGRSIRVLLGGGIGSGKSAAGRMFEQLGATVIDADRLGHAVIEPGGEAFVAVRQRWPSVVVDGHIDRTALAKIVFADPEQLAELEALTHPAILARIGDVGSTEHDLVVEIPLMLGVPGEWTRVCVDADEAIRVERAVGRGQHEADVRRRIANQVGRDDWLMWADRVLANDTTLAHLSSQVEAMWREFRSTGHGSGT